MSSPTFTVQHVAKPTDPLAIALTGGNTSLLPDLAQSMIRPIAFQIGDMYIASDENGTMIGFTMWVPPGQLLFSTEEQLKLGHMDFLSKLSDDVKAYSATATELNCYWCNFNFVKTNYQGKGVAKAMFQLALQKAHQSGFTMGLATTDARNVIIYERLGFEMKGFREMPSPWGSWPAWIFVRRA
ncbi:hypothetical protein WOLCODRAFT_90202 [Wolfiporia cocos MD-104 SS10]|uniref:N-acetyltransferase domain-containing protein n=1 Tax=Wolfiporia cocos (strain MD-104) TaxID=742152 RepID=A0A2H3JMU6_WOLCO|nr:hypothetical protein WOLCODRAFT_90202 [Wolfiporia cocos MD-104 SS10]